MTRRSAPTSANAESLRRAVEAAERAGVPVLGVRLPGAGEGVATVAIPAHKHGSPANPREFVVEVPGWRPPTVNQLMRGKLRDRMRLAKSARREVLAAVRLAGVPPATGKRRVSLVVTLGPGRKAFDVDAPWKATLDALKDAGAIRDDSHKWCVIGSLDFRRSPAGDATTIILQDIGEGPTP